jgi:hypothetical protein
MLLNVGLCSRCTNLKMRHMLGITAKLGIASRYDKDKIMQKSICLNYDCGVVQWHKLAAACWKTL